MNLVKQLEIALAESVKLQSHYASQLNVYDGGKRMEFKNSGEWMSRLRETRTIKAIPSNLPTHLIGELEMMAQHCSDMEVEFGTENTGNDLGKLCQKAADSLRSEYERFAKSEGQRIRLQEKMSAAADLLRPEARQPIPNLMAIREAIELLRC